MAVNNIVKRIQNIMRQDAGVNGDAQRIEQMTWMFFLKVYDTQEETWEYKAQREHTDYKSVTLPIVLYQHTKQGREEETLTLLKRNFILFSLILPLVP